jgi:hypothetical protein
MACGYFLMKMRKIGAYFRGAFIDVRCKAGLESRRYILHPKAAIHPLEAAHSLPAAIEHVP